MLNLGKLGAGPDAGRYYERQMAGGLEDYYAGEGEAPGVWTGTGSMRLGLRGAVAAGQIDRLLAAQHPLTGAPLRRPLAASSVAGFDLTFKAPKSVGLLFGIGDTEVADAALDAHDAAVREALGYLERRACVVRRGHGGVITQPGSGFIAAAFRHRTSRAGDPLLHTHVVIANEAQGPDGRFTALDGRLIYGHARTAGFLYQAALRAELTERLGVRWQPVHNGCADIDGISRRTVERFSTRRGEILAVMEERGEHSAKAAQIATLDTRGRKDHDTPIAELRERWRLEAWRCGLRPENVEELLHRDPPPLDQAELERHTGWLLGPDGLTRSSSSFDRLAVVRAFAEHARHGEHVAVLERRADALLGSAEVVRLDHGRFSTRELLAIEARLLADTAGRAGDHRATVEHRHLDVALRARPTLSAEQRDLITRLTTAPGGVQIVRAAAGTGKTFALDGARDAWEHAGIPVLGCALSARAACEMRDQTAMAASTIARLRYALDRGGRLQPGSVLIVDEAGMVGTRDLAALAHATTRAQGRLVLVGDDRQLPEIDAGGAFRALADQHDAIQLNDVRRQTHEWDRQALGQLRAGDLEKFARAYLRNGRVVMTPTAAGARDALVSDWWDARQDGDRALMIAHRRADVADLNGRARQRMRDGGQLADDTLTTEQRAFAVGDRVIATRNDRRLGVHNGQAGTLHAINDHQVEITLDDDTPLTLPTSYARDGHLDHGYALTAHRAQGATVDQAFVLGSDELYREWGYTALSRHRDQARFYLSATPAFLNDPPQPVAAGRGAEEAVVDALTASRAEHLAITHVRRDTRLDDLDEAHQSLDETRARHGRLQAERDTTPRYRRAARAELDDLAARAERETDYWRDRIERHETDLAARPPRTAPTLTPARDPLTGLDTDPRPDNALESGLCRDLDDGLDLGM